MMEKSNGFLSKRLNTNILLISLLLLAILVATGCSNPETSPSISLTMEDSPSGDHNSDTAFTLKLKGTCSDCGTLDVPYAGYGRVVVRVPRTWVVRVASGANEIYNDSDLGTVTGIDPEDSTWVYKAFQTTTQLTTSETSREIDLTVYPYFSADDFSDASLPYTLEAAFSLSTDSSTWQPLDHNLDVNIINVEPDANPLFCFAGNPTHWNQDADAKDRCCGDDIDDCGTIVGNKICMNNSDRGWVSNNIGPKVITSSCGNYDLAANNSQWLRCENPLITTNCIASLSSDNNAHLADCGLYDYQLVCDPAQGYENVAFSCSFKTDCDQSDPTNPEVELFDVSNHTNAHFGIKGTADNALYSYLRVCCKGKNGVVFFNDGGQNDINLLDYSADVNAHVAKYGSSYYSNSLTTKSRIQLNCEPKPIHVGKYPATGLVTIDTATQIFNSGTQHDDFLCNFGADFQPYQNMKITQCLRTSESGPGAVTGTTVWTVVQDLQPIRATCDNGIWKLSSDPIDKAACGKDWIGNGSNAGQGKCCGDDSYEREGLVFSEYFEWPNNDYTSLGASYHPGAVCFGGNAQAEGKFNGDTLLNANGTIYACNMTTPARDSLDVEKYDLNCDGKIDAKDLQIVINNFLGNTDKTGVCPDKTADVDSGGIGLSDIDAMQAKVTEVLNPLELYSTVPELYSHDLVYRNPDDLQLLINPSHNVTNCQIVQGFYCSYPNTWKSLADYYSGATSLQLRPGYPTQDPISPSSNAYSCCLPNDCWNQDQGACVDGDDPTSSQVVSDDTNTYICNHGNWASAEAFVKHDWDGDTGYCTGTNQCVVVNPSKVPGKTFCVENDTYIQDHLCIDGTWTTRTAKVAHELLQYAADNDDYVLACGNFSMMLPFVDEKQTLDPDGMVNLKNYLSGDYKYCISDELGNTSPINDTKAFFDGATNQYKGLLFDPPVSCVNNFCVLRIDSGDEKGVYFGYSYNNHNVAGNNIGPESYLQPLSGNYVNIPHENILIYNLGRGTQQAPGFIATLTNFIQAVYHYMFPISPPVVEIPLTAQDIYVAKKGPKTVYGIIDPANFTNAKTKMVVRYENYQDLNISGAKIKTNLQYNSTNGGADQYIYAITAGGVQYWTDLTMRLRPLSG